MAFSMHSHSGQFCPGHAKDQLEEIVQTAIARGMTTLGLTEHMPRDNDKDRYPEEESLAPLLPRHEAYIEEATRLRAKYASQIKLLIGFEGEWIRSSSQSLVENLASNPHIDYFIGSVHHVHEIPIDYDRSMYFQARLEAGGTDEQLFEDYFDAQFHMLQALRPRVVGHFDLIRLLSDEPNRDVRSLPRVWEKIIRNLKCIVEQEALMEINTSALRKGLEEPYPTRGICEEYLRLGGRLTLSDDSHGITQVGTNFERAFTYLESIGVMELFVLESNRAMEPQHKTISLSSSPLSKIKASFTRSIDDS